jgi:hypothetical protein
VNKERPSVDWTAAFAYYASVDRHLRSYRDVGRRFGVSDTRVRQIAHRDNWQERARELDRRASREVEKRVVKDRARRITETLELIDLARSELHERLRAGDAELRLADLPALVKLESLLEGEATARVEIFEVKVVLSSFLGVAMRYVPRSEQRAFLAEAESAAGGMLELSPAAEAP